MFRIIVDIGDRVKVHRQGETFTDALGTVSVKLRELAKTVMLEEWQKGQLVRRVEITAQIKASLVSS